MMSEDIFKQLFLKTIDNQDNPYHPLVWIHGEPKVGQGTYIGGFSEVNAKGANVTIGSDCDIASFVAINVADSHRRCIGLDDTNECRDILIDHQVFIGSHSTVLGGSVIGHHSVIAAGSVVRSIVIPPFSLFMDGKVRADYYRVEYEAKHGPWRSDDSS